MIKRSYNKWTTDQRLMLEALVNKQKKTRNKVSWIQIASKVVGKSPRQCYDQWLHIVHHKI